MDVWVVVPLFLVGGHSWFSVVVYGYFITSHHAKGALQLLGTAALVTAIATMPIFMHALPALILPTSGSESDADASMTAPSAVAVSAQ
jgi:hypothetical protein